MTDSKTDMVLGDNRSSWPQPLLSAHHLPQAERAAETIAVNLFELIAFASLLELITSASLLELIASVSLLELIASVSLP